MANCLKLYEVHSFSTSPNSRQCTTMLNEDVQNCYIVTMSTFTSQMFVNGLFRMAGIGWNSSHTKYAK